MSAGTGGASPKVSKDLGLLAPKFREAVEKALAVCNAPPHNLDAMVYEALRSQELQAIYYARGRTVVPPTHTVTNAPTNLYSWHGYGLAVDVVHRTKFWEPPGGAKWFEKVAKIFKEHDCAWGGDWTKPDLPHFQWGRCKPSPSDKARELFKGQNFRAVWEAVGAGSPGSTASPPPTTPAPTPPTVSPPAPPTAVSPPTPTTVAAAVAPLAWGAKVSPAFRKKVVAICGRLGLAEPDYLMACMAFESGRTFSPSIKNAAGSGAVGLIQFMPATAKGLGTTTALLSAMTAEAQLDFVEKHFKPFKGRLHTLADVYMTILWPAAVGKPDDYALFAKANSARAKAYAQNAGLDKNHDLVVTKAEAAAKVQAMLDEGRKAANRA